MMIHEITRSLGTKRGDPIALLVVASFFREEMPWMYELGMEAYRAAKDGVPGDAIAARRRFLKAADIMRRGRFGPDEYGFDTKMMHMLMRDLDHLIEMEFEPEADSVLSGGEHPKLPRSKSDKSA
jgi:hypothetical protein